MFSSMLSLLGSLRRGNFVTNSLRFRSSASAYLNRTNIVAGNSTTSTWSGWVKRGSLTTANSSTFWAAGAGVSSNAALAFTTSDQLILAQNNPTQTIYRISTAVYRDPSAWYHIVFVLDTNNPTAQNRARIWVNGVEITSWATNTTIPSGTTFWWNAISTTHTLGSNYTNVSSQYFDGYLTEVNFIDGQALTPSSFGQIESTTGVWSPKQYVGSYGANGFYLKFSDASAATAAAIGKDSSGNGNNWTPSGISVTAGVFYDSMIDVPVNYNDSGNGRGNYAVLNPLARSTFVANSSNPSRGNLAIYNATTTAWAEIIATLGVSSGKWYWEIFASNITTNSDLILGVVSDQEFSNLNSSNKYVGSNAFGYGYYSATGNKYNNAIGAAYGAAYSDLNVIGVALDMDAGTLTFYKNNVSQGVAFSGLTGLIYPAFSSMSGVGDVNFGQRPFSYTPPAGFRALNTNNLPTPSIVNGANFMAATAYTGNAAARSLSNAVNNVSFQPDLVWIKSRTPGATSHALFDSVRGTTKYLSSDTTAAETTLAQSLTAFGANGFSLGTDTTLVNANANSYIAWQWKAGDSTVTNTAGSITSQVNANTTAGFSIVNYTGTGVNATVGHGLGVAPKMIITKDRDTVINWVVYHESMGGTSFVRLNTTDPKITDAVIYNGTPSSTVFNIGIGIGINTATKRMVSYCFAEIAGFSKFGTYTGNGSADGPFVFCGFRPRFVIVKRTDATGDWRLWDSARDTYNAAPNVLFSNLSNVEASSAASPIDVLSNGFKLRGTGGDPNTTGGTYIFAAFAEVPTKYALAR